MQENTLNEFLSTTINSDDSQSPEKPKTTIIFDKYDVGKLVGRGSFAKVYLGRDIRTGHSVAIKSVSKQKIQNNNLMAHVIREVSIMRQMRHPHIMRLHEVLATKTKVYFIMDFAKGGELFAKLTKGRFSEDLSRRYFHQLISAVGYCHSRGVYHRDLKPENLLLDENWSLKISDFGLSAVKDPTRADPVLNTLCGTPAYVAPEILAKRGYNGAKVDIWSCGIILFVLTSGYLPFNDTNIMNLYRKIYRGEFRCPRWMSPELRRFLGRILDPKPETRITIDEMIQDPWFKKGYNEVKLSWYDGETNGNNTGNKYNDEVLRQKCGEVGFLNAFDLISYSPGFSLSGLFGVEEGKRKERFVAVAQEVEVVVQEIEEGARRINDPKIEVRRVKGGKGVIVEGQNGDFGAEISVARLTEELVVVEVWKSENEDVSGERHDYDFWTDKLMPKICHLFC